MRRSIGDIIRRIGDINVTQVVEDKQKIRNELQKDVEEFLRRGGKVIEVNGSLASARYCGDETFKFREAAIVAAPAAGTLSDNYARGREILRKKREAEKKMRDRMRELNSRGDLRSDPVHEFDETALDGGEDDPSERGLSGDGAYRPEID